MKILFYILISIFFLLGFGTLIAAYQARFRQIGLVLGAVSYLGAAFFAYHFTSWWPFLIGFVVALLVRILGGDPSS